MTSPPLDPPQPLNTNQATAIMTPSGAWLDIVPGSLLLVKDPVFINGITGDPEPMGGLWCQATDTAGNSFGFPVAPGQPWVRWAIPPPP
jgi:hypothetical protein